VKVAGVEKLTSQFMFAEDSASFSSDNVAASLVSGGTLFLVTLAPTSGVDSSGSIALVASKQVVGVGEEALAAGFVIQGSGTLSTLVRAVGPSLAALGAVGVLANPMVEILDAAGRLVASNDNWDTSSVSAFEEAGALVLAPGSRDAAVVTTLDANASYTAVVSGIGSGSGEALVEIYVLP
jgi:hypothetical protein